MTKRGRPTKTDSMIKQFTAKRAGVVTTGVGENLEIPNHSGVASHPEAINAFGMWKKNSSDSTKIYYDGGNVGIGLTNPTAKLHVIDSLGGGMIFNSTSVDSDAKLWLQNDSSNIWRIENQGSQSDRFTIIRTQNVYFTIDTSGNVDILSGTLDMNTHKIVGVVDPTTDQEVATKKYVDDNAGLWEIDGSETQLKTGDAIDMQTNKIINCVDPTANQEVATKKYVDDNAGSSPLTTKGDVFVYSTVDARLPVGTNGQILTADSAETTGLKWSSFLGTSVTATTFDITANTAVIAAAGAGIKIKVVGISLHNNESVGSNDTPVKITDGDAGTNLYGGATGHVYVTGRGGPFVLPIQVDAPYFETTANTALYINPTSSKRVSGVVWHVNEA